MLRTYPELPPDEILEVDLVEDGRRLESVEDGSQDFVIANHVFEHCDDPIQALASWLRVTRPGGHVFLAIPDKRGTFDKPRPLTSVEHILRDHQEGPGVSRREHFIEHGFYMKRMRVEEAQHWADTAMVEKDHVHFHVWTHESLLQLFRVLETTMPFELVHSRSSRKFESVLVLRRT